MRAFAAVSAFVLICSVPAASQQWNDPRTLALVERATQKRAAQLADTGLVDYSATAHGYLTFLAQLGEGFHEPPKIVRADELMLDIFWRAPNFSRQRVYGRRDTLLLPTDIQYHRDHLGIVQNNFPNIIRIGEGDEVRDVPHPLSSSGLSEYDFAIRDSLQIHLGPRVLDVYEVRVRPKNASEPRTVGSVFIDRESGDVVRMTFSFTRAALIDKDLEDVSVVLENGLIEGRFWLPRRQEIEIRRTGTWLEFPARGIIRGRWEICCYKVNAGVGPVNFAGPEIVIMPFAARNRAPFRGQILDSLPGDVRAVVDADVRKVQEEARSLVRAQALARTRRGAMAGRTLSDFIRVNRYEGVSIGEGAKLQLGSGMSVNSHAHFGFGDHQPKGSLELRSERASGAAVFLVARREYEDVSDMSERSTAVNSIASQEFGSDYSDLYDSKSVALGFVFPTLGSWILNGTAERESEGGLEIHARPATGHFNAALSTLPLKRSKIEFDLEHPSRLGPLGFEIRSRAAISGSRFTPRDSSGERASLFRSSFLLQLGRPFRTMRFESRTYAAGVSSARNVPIQDLVFLGGPVTSPGYDFHALAGRFGFSQRLELQLPVAVPSFALGRYGRTPARSPLSLFATMAGISHPVALSNRATLGRGIFPSVGVGLSPLFELIRFDVARGLRDGRWSFYFDVNRDFWSVL